MRVPRWRWWYPSVPVLFLFAWTVAPPLASLYLAPWVWDQGYRKTAIVLGLQPSGFYGDSAFPDTITGKITPWGAALRTDDGLLMKLLVRKSVLPRLYDFPISTLQPTTNRLLLQAGFDPNREYENMSWALFVLRHSSQRSYEEQEQIVNDLLRAGLDLNRRHSGSTLLSDLYKQPLDRYRHLSLLSLLVSKGADIDQMEIKGRPLPSLLEGKYILEEDTLLLCLYLRHSKRAIDLSQVPTHSQKFLNDLMASLRRSQESKRDKEPCPKLPPNIVTKSLDLSNAHRIVLDNGDPKVGDIYFLKQIHPALSKGLDGDLSGFEVSSKRLSTGYAQLAIMTLIRDLHLHIVFNEGESQPPFPPLPKPFLCSQLQANRLSPILLENLYVNGGPHYAACFGDVTIRRTQSVNTAAKLNAHLLGNLKFSSLEEENAFIFLKREREALEFVKEFLDEHPGSRVGLVFGAAHRFSSDVIRTVWTTGPGPRVQSFELMTPIAQEVLIREQPLAACQEEAVVQQSTMVTLGTLQKLKTVSARRAALAKLDPLSVSHPSFRASDVGVRDCDCETDPKEFGNIDTWARGITSVPEAEPRQAGLPNNIESLSAEALTASLSRETHVPTQREIIKRARALTVDAVRYITNPQDQILALDKLVGSCADRERVLMVIEDSKGFFATAVSDELQKRKKTGAPPFVGCSATTY